MQCLNIAKKKACSGLLHKQPECSLLELVPDTACSVRARIGISVSLTHLKMEFPPVDLFTEMLGLRRTTQAIAEIKT